MKALKVEIFSWTASFRYPLFITGYQPTLTIPPLSTLYGLISAAKGEIVSSKDTKIGFYSEFQTKKDDLETIYEIVKGKIGKSNVYKREILYNFSLYLYLTNLDLRPYFECPFYSILLGRTYDLAMIKKVSIVDLQKTTKAYMKGTLLPKSLIYKVSGEITRIPIEVNQEIPRRIIQSDLFIVINQKQEIEYDPIYIDAEASKDPEKKYGIIFYPIS